MLCVVLSFGDTVGQYMEQTGIKRGNRQLIQVRYRLPRSCDSGKLKPKNVVTYYNTFLPEVDELSQNAHNQS